MTRPARRRIRWLIGLLVLVAVVLFTPCFGMIWDGGFPSAEYRFKFVDEVGRPVPGVTLRVLTKAGGVSHLYPVNEFVPDQTPTSDANGEMVFHHAPIYLEFGGTTYRNLVGMKFGDTVPKYDCVFLLDAQEVHRERYEDLLPCGYDNRHPVVTRRWEYPDWPPMREWKEHNYSSAYIRSAFDANGDGELDHEESVAVHYFDWIHLDSLEHGGVKDIQFTLVERTIVLRRR